jgi:glycosyltransferase involved in cell wall biosynthesis
MPTAPKLRIAIVSAFYSEGMGYSENCLPKALVGLGHDVHVVASTFNVYGNESLYDETYRDFLGPRELAPGVTRVDGYQVHRLAANLVSGYVSMKGLLAKIGELSPHIVHSIEIASLQTFALAMKKPFARYKLFCETHQTMSVLKPYMKQAKGAWLKKAAYRMTRTLPTYLASLAVEKCYAVTPDCGEVAARFYGVPRSKLRLLSLGTDTDLFHPAESVSDRAAKRELRELLGFRDDDIVCIYTGRFSRDKNPLLLARAIDALTDTDPQFKGLFVGEGVQGDAIAACRNTTIVPFMTHQKLARHYRASDVAVWPRQESMSMLDAASSGLPLVVSNKIGEPQRMSGNGKVYEENTVASLRDVLRTFASAEERRSYGTAGRRKMLDGFSWARFARSVESDFLGALTGDGQEFRET